MVKKAARKPLQKATEKLVGLLTDVKLEVLDKITPEP